MRIPTLAAAAALIVAALPAFGQTVGQDQIDAPAGVEKQVEPPANPQAGPRIVPVPEAQPQAQTQIPTPPQTQAEAPAAPVSVPPGRFSFQRSGEGLLRLDSESGQIAYCSPRTAGWACQAVPEDRAALEKEIGRLQDEVATLRKEVAQLREPPPPPAPPRPPADLSPPPKGDDARQLREDLQRARAAVENAWHRLVEMIQNLQKDMMRKG